MLTLKVGASTILFCAATTSAQMASVRPGDQSLGAWAGGSLYSPVGAHLGKTPNRDLFLGALRYERVLKLFGQSFISATADLIPVAIVTNNPTYRKVIIPAGSPANGKAQTGSGPVYGTGLTPFGVKTTSPSIGRVKIYLGAGLGFLWFTRNTPVPDARRLNATVDFGGGLEFAHGRRQAISVGYRFHHLSNAYTAPQNPGLDGNVFYLGFARH